jgi:hypothetical protein
MKNVEKSMILNILEVKIEKIVGRKVDKDITFWTFWTVQNVISERQLSKFSLTRTVQKLETLT